MAGGDRHGGGGTERRGVNDGTERRGVVGGDEGRVGPSAYLLLLIPLALIVLGQSSAKLAGNSLSLLFTGGDHLAASEHGRAILLFAFLTYFFFGLRGFVWAIILKRMKLSVAYPILSLSFPLILLVSFLFFDERVTVYNMLGAMLLIAGIGLISKGEARPARKDGSKGTTRERAGGRAIPGRKMKIRDGDMERSDSDGEEER